MHVSEQDHEYFYGDPSKAAKMTGQDQVKKFYNNLTSLEFDEAKNFTPHFDLVAYEKLVYKTDPIFVQFLYLSK